MKDTVSSVEFNSHLNANLRKKQNDRTIKLKDEILPTIVLQICSCVVEFLIYYHVVTKDRGTNNNELW